MNLLVIFENCILAVAFAICISYCETHKIRYIIHQDMLEKSSHLNERFQSLVAQYNRLSEEWYSSEENDANYVAKFCMGIIVLGSFIKNALRLDKTQKFTAIVSIMVPIILLLLTVHFVRKNNRTFIEFKKTGRGQKSFPAMFGFFIDEIEKYSYIENSNDVNEELKDIDKTCFRIEERISAIKKLQRLEHKYITHWLMCTSLLATLLFIF